MCPYVQHFAKGEMRFRNWILCWTELNLIEGIPAERKWKDLLFLFCSTPSVFISDSRFPVSTARAHFEGMNIASRLDGPVAEDICMYAGKYIELEPEKAAWLLAVWGRRREYVARSDGVGAAGRRKVIFWKWTSPLSLWYNAFEPFYDRTDVADAWLASNHRFLDYREGDVHARPGSSNVKRKRKPRVSVPDEYTL